MDRLRILIVSPELPSRRAGSQVRLLGLTSSLAGAHSVSLLSLETPGGNAKEIAAVRAYCDEVVTVRTGRPVLMGARKRSLQLRSLLSTRSYPSLVHDLRSFQAAIDQMMDRGRYDIVQVEHCYMAQYVFPRGVPVVLDEHNIEYEIPMRTASVGGGVLRKAYGSLDSLKLRREEERSWRSVDACAVTSPRDEAMILRAVPEARTAVVPNAVDTEFFSARRPRGDPGTLLFFGTMSHYPNRDAVLFFLDEIMPLLRRSHPSLRLHVVGAWPPAEVLRRASRDVTVTGEVDDVRPYLDKARVVIVPLRAGGGTRLKILEAMAMARPVVSTRIGAEGLAVSDEQDILLADTAESFAAKVRRVLDDDELADSLGSAGRRLVETTYQWSVAARNLDELYRSVLTTSAGDPATGRYDILADAGVAR